ncbi:MAG: BatA domain-containing protein [Candidatus Brocadiia bacterium]
MPFISALNPFLLWGSLAVASPIIIHLLSKRRFTVLNWAAMDFLLQADQQNRRRVRLEHLLLLILRCLLLLLIAALVARPVFDPSGLGAAGLNMGRCEHIILLDDSPSMGARRDNQSVFDKSLNGLTSFLQDLSDQRPQDSFTLLLTSDPERPFQNATSLASKNLPSVIRRVEDLKVSDVAAHIDRALLALKSHISETEGDINRSIVIISDFRSRDWLPGEKVESGQGPLTMVENLAKTNPDVNWRMVDTGNFPEDNVGITAIDPPRGAIAENVPARFEVHVQNFGPADVDNIEVVFSSGGLIPLRSRIDTIPPGGEESVPFTFSFQDTGPARVQAELEKDELLADNIRRYAADVTKGARVLLVDGEPAMKPSNAESFYLQRALAPPGDTESGYVISVISGSQLSDHQLDSYKLIVLANVFRISQELADKLKKWVAAGGGLVYFLGDQADPSSYNAVHKGHPRLFPVTLNEIFGDPSEEKWIGLKPRAVNHPLLKIFAGEKNPLLERVKIFRWWDSKFDPKTIPGGTVSVLATFNNVEKSPAILQSNLGQGRIAIFLLPADAEWSTWVSSPSYLVTIQEMARHLVRPVSDHRQIVAGQNLREPVDPSDFVLEATVTKPDGEPGGTLQAAPLNDTNKMVFQYLDTAEVGFYRLQRELRDGTPAPALFAVNLDPDEGDLEHVPKKRFATLRKRSNVDVAKTSSNLKSADVANKMELWKPLLIVLVAVLCAEQLLGWAFGHRRQFTT